MVSAASLALTVSFAQRIKKHMSVKEKLIQSWRYKTLTVIKRYKNHLSLSLAVSIVPVVTYSITNAVEINCSLVTAKS